MIFNQPTAPFADTIGRFVTVMETKTELTPGQHLANMAMFGQLFNPKDDETLMIAVFDLLAGKLDESVFYFNERSGYDLAVVKRNLEQLKEEFRDDIRRGIREADQILAEKAVRDLSAQHSAGTTKEIAEMLGVSVKQVRKMKRDGTLDAALEEHANAS
jgi:hypothetical protein